MKLTKAQSTQIEHFAKRKITQNNDPFHDWSHVVRTSKLAVYIAKKEKANVEVCKVAGLLHDIAPKIWDKTHGVESAQMAKNFLNKIKVDKEFIKQVYLAIAFHDTAVQYKANTLEGKIIFEADKLQCFGPIGLIREYGDLLLQGKDPNKVLASSIDYLLSYNPPFTTTTGKQLKKELRNFNKLFIKTFNKWDQVKI